MTHHGRGAVRQTRSVTDERAVGGHERLLGGFARHVGRLAVGAPREDVLAVGHDLLSRYAEPQRAYHDGRHLAEVLAAAALLSSHAADLPVVVAAAWWHDAVYDVHAAPGANESASADLAVAALSGLGVDPARVTEVERLVRLTAGHDPAAGDADGAVLCDADLAVLAAGVQRYAEYVADVRREYAHVPDDVFRAGRSAVLRDLLSHERLYRTSTAHEAWETTARANLEAELLTLSR